MYMNLFTSMYLNLLWQTNVTFCHPFFPFWETNGQKLCSFYCIMPTQELSLLPRNSHIFQSGMHANKSVRWIGYRNASVYLRATCLATLIPAGHLQLWLATFDSILVTSFSSSVEPCYFWEVGHLFGNRMASTLIKYIPVSCFLFRDLLQSHLHRKREAWGQNYSHVPQVKPWSLIVSTFRVVFFGFRPPSH